MNPAGPICKGVVWVCKNHPDKPWDAELCGAGAPCKCNETEGIDESDVSRVIVEDGPQRRN